jgi:hypothetical protein
MNLILYDFEVQNLLKNGKGQIRRAIPIKFLPGYNPEWTGYRPIFEYGEFYLANSKGEPATKEIKCPFNVGEECWVRETWLKADDGYYYKANSSSVSEEARKDYGYKWRSPITMPREASRFTVMFDDVTHGRLQDMTEQDAIECGFEGVRCHHHPFGNTVYGCTDCYNTGWLEPPTAEFVFEWDSHAKPGYKFADNPVVWCGEMKVKEY